MVKKVNISYPHAWCEHCQQLLSYDKQDVKESNSHGLCYYIFCCTCQDRIWIPDEKVKG